VLHIRVQAVAVRIHGNDGGSNDGGEFDWLCGSGNLGSTRIENPDPA
jgi:hypothetical protein